MDSADVRQRRGLQFRGDKAHRCGNDAVRGCVQDKACFVPDSKFARVDGSKKHGHVHVGEIDECHDRRARRDAIARVRRLILDLSFAGRQRREFANHQS